MRKIRITKEKIQLDHSGSYEFLFFVDAINGHDAINLGSFKTEDEAIKFKNEELNG